MTNITRRGWGVSVTPRPLFTPGKDPVPIVQEAGWAPGPVWTDAENLAPNGIRSPVRPARSQSLYRLSYPALKVYFKVYVYTKLINTLCSANAVSFTLNVAVHITANGSYTVQASAFGIVRTLLRLLCLWIFESQNYWLGLSWVGKNVEWRVHGFYYFQNFIIPLLSVLHGVKYIIYLFVYLVGCVIS
jgi:hypothetical protein